MPSAIYPERYGVNAAAGCKNPRPPRRPQGASSRKAPPRAGAGGSLPRAPNNGAGGLSRVEADRDGPARLAVRVHADLERAGGADLDEARALIVPRVILGGLGALAL